METKRLHVLAHPPRLQLALQDPGPFFIFQSLLHCSLQASEELALSQRCGQACFKQVLPRITTPSLEKDFWKNNKAFKPLTTLPPRQGIQTTQEEKGPQRTMLCSSPMPCQFRVQRTGTQQVPTYRKPSLQLHQPVNYEGKAGKT